MTTLLLFNAYLNMRSRIDAAHGLYDLTSSASQKAAYTSRLMLYEAIARRLERRIRARLEV